MDKVVHNGSVIESRFQVIVDDAFNSRRKTLMKKLEPFLRELDAIDANVPKNVDVMAWKIKERKRLLKAYDVKKEILQFLKSASDSCASEFEERLYAIGTENLLYTVEGEDV